MAKELPERPPKGPKRNSTAGRLPKEKRSGARASSIKNAESDAYILQLRREGWALQAIGDAQDPPIGAQRVQEIIKAHLKRITLAPAEDVLKLELARIDELQTAFYPAAVGGDAVAFDKVMACMDRRGKLLGLDKAPINQGDEMMLAAKATLIEKLESLGAKLLAGSRAPTVIDVTANAIPAG